MTTQEAEVFGRNREVKDNNAQALKQELSNLPADQMPDLVVAFRGKVVTLAHINPKSDDALARLLHEVTKDAETFPKPEVKKRKAAGVEEDATE